MGSDDDRSNLAAFAVRKPTEILCGDCEPLSLIEIYGLITKGFFGEDVRKMISCSELYSRKLILKRILGASSKTARTGASRLSPQQSAVAYQFAETLEKATRVFGTQISAECWLDRPNRYFNGKIPVDIVNNPVGFRMVKEYLERAEYGIYQ